MTSILEKDFSNLSDGSSGAINPQLLSDIRFGNQRDERDENEFKDLVESVKKHGVFTPVTIWANKSDLSKLELICGHGRRDAAIKAKSETIPFIYREVSEQQAFEMHLAENLERESLGTVAKAKAIQHYLTLYKGDYEASASKLNLKVRECRELVELNKCCEKVLKAIKNKTISPAHAIVLAPFPHITQEKNLDTIIAEGWTVRTLRERAGKAKLPLDKGIFDKSDCETCEYNTNPQLGLWGSTDTKAQCAKPVCFQQKTTKHLLEQKTSLEERYGQILLLSECDSKSQTTVSIENVGKAQFSACIACDNRIAVLNDSWSKAGQVTESQCTNKECFTKCNSAIKKPSKSNDSKKVSDKKNSDKKVKVSSPKKTTQGIISPAIKAQYDKELRTSASRYFQGDENFNDSLITASLISQASFKINGKSSNRFSDVLVLCLSMDNEKRKSIRTQATEHLLKETETDCNHSTVTATLINCLNVEGEKAEKYVTEQWQPTDENLKIYTIEILKQLAISVGIDKATENTNKGEFEKIFKQGKPKIIKFIQSSNVDWTNYAPRNFKESLKKGVK